MVPLLSLGTSPGWGVGRPISSRVELMRAQGIRDQLHMLGTGRPPEPQQCWPGKWGVPSNPRQR